MSAIMLCTTADAQNLPKRKPGLWEAQMATAAADQVLAGLDQLTIERSDSRQL